MAAEIRRQFGRFRSAYYAQSELPPAERVAPAPTVIWNAWTDDIMPPGEALRYAKLVRSEFPGAQIGVVLGDGFAHNADRSSRRLCSTIANASCSSTAI